MKNPIYTLLFLLLCGANLATAAEAISPQPKVLLFSAVDSYYAADRLEFWGNTVGINGFMLSYLAEWWSSKNELAQHEAVLKKINSQGQQYGIDSNFIKVALGNNRLPLWTDDQAWAGVIYNFKNIAELARQTGSKGITLDTEAYSIELFDSRALRFKSIPREILKGKIYLRGQQLMQAMTTVYPDIEIILLPEGAFYWFNPHQGAGSEAYELWIDFYNGMASVKNSKGIILGSERTYSVTDADSLINISHMIDNTMKVHADNPSFWQQRCSIAPGLWPLGKEYDNKAPWYTPEAFRTQFTQAAALSPKYVWIYDHGSAWFQLKPGDVARYNPGGKRLWGKDYQVLPTADNIDAYYGVLRDYKKN